MGMHVSIAHEGKWRPKWRSVLNATGIMLQTAPFSGCLGRWLIGNVNQKRNKTFLSLIHCPSLVSLIPCPAADRR